MSESMTIACPGCGLNFDLTAEYVREYGTLNTTCTRCGAEFTLPGADDFVPDADADAAGEASPSDDAQADPMAGESSFDAPEAADIPAALTPTVDPGIIADGWYVIVQRNSVFPARCALCNQPTDLEPLIHRVIKSPMIVPAILWTIPFALVVFEALFPGELDFAFDMSISKYTAHVHVGGMIEFVLLLAPLLYPVLRRLDIFPSFLIKPFLCPAHRRRYLLFKRGVPVVVALGFLTVCFGHMVGTALFSLSHDGGGKLAGVLAFDMLTLGGYVIMIIAAVLHAIFATPFRAAAIDKQAAVISGCGKRFLLSLPSAKRKSPAAMASAG
ncbi:MAG TPA: hypothetical protein VFE47_21230 [Tepidisphaeraceae bacterium]|jgi:hypothetical protein|nr:hypothetical protein [Tepidisphaeraceae bacterium]